MRNFDVDLKRVTYLHYITAKAAHKFPLDSHDFRRVALPIVLGQHDWPGEGVACGHSLSRHVKIRWRHGYHEC